MDSGSRSRATVPHRATVPQIGCKCGKRQAAQRGGGSKRCRRQQRGGATAHRQESGAEWRQGGAAGRSDATKEGGREGDPQLRRRGAAGKLQNRRSVEARERGAWGATWRQEASGGGGNSVVGTCALSRKKRNALQHARNGNILALAATAAGGSGWQRVEVGLSLNLREPVEVRRLRESGWKIPAEERRTPWCASKTPGWSRDGWRRWQPRQADQRWQGLSSSP